MFLFSLWRLAAMRAHLLNTLCASIPPFIMKHEIDGWCVRFSKIVATPSLAALLIRFLS